MLRLVAISQISFNQKSGCDCKKAVSAGDLNTRVVLNGSTVDLFQIQLLGTASISANAAGANDRCAKRCTRGSAGKITFLLLVSHEIQTQYFFTRTWGFL
jgi:hypothetical protein